MRLEVGIEGEREMVVVVVRGMADDGRAVDGMRDGRSCLGAPGEEQTPPQTGALGSYVTRPFPLPPTLLSVFT